ncbi:hypothetical protein LIER_16631 [Lithospermum erythrorhizon]|uniref:Aminotransferase-like plant mobile domain-containing protein n=1 Tax=Lithospermum erythrorhizon TaxID=34254 RepID=A0AAV3Q9W9_LITER
MVAKAHLRHLREHYSISPKVQMRALLEGETVYSPVFWEFFNYGLRLRASPFVNSLLSTIGRAPGQLGHFSWATVTAFQVGCLSFGVVPRLKNMLYSEKPRKVSPTRLHWYMFLVKDAFSDDVPRQFCMDYTTLEFEEFREKLVSDHTISERKLKSEVDTLKECSQKATLDFEKTKVELSETRSLLEDCLAEKESMNSRLFLVENSVASAVEDFKGSSELGDDYVVDLFDDIPDDDDEDVGADEEDIDACEGGEDV